MQYDLRDLPSSVQENMDAQVTVKVPATPNRKAYEYTKNTSGGVRPAGIGLSKKTVVAGAAGGLAGLALFALKEKAASVKAKRAKAEGEKQKKKLEEDEAEFEKKFPRQSKESLEKSREKSARVQKMTKLSPSEERLQGAFRKQELDDEVEKSLTQKSRALELNRRKRSTRKNSLDERIDAFLIDLSLEFQD